MAQLPLQMPPHHQQMESRCFDDRSVVKASLAVADMQSLCGAYLLTGAMCVLKFLTSLL